MHRRPESNTTDDLVELMSMFPWWIGLTLALFSYLGLHIGNFILQALLPILRQ